MIVGEAHVVVRAITNSVGPEIRRAFSDRSIDRIGQDTGRRIGDGISQGIGRGGGSGGFFSSLAGQAEAARAQFDNLLRTAYTLGPAIAGIAGAVSSLIGAFAGLASTVAGALPALAAIPALLANIAIAGGTLKLAFAGVGEAISAGMKQATSGAGGAAAATRDLTAELRRLRDAERAYSKAVETREETMRRAGEARDRALTLLAEKEADSAKRLEAAQQDVAKAVAEGAERIQDAQNRLTEVERESSEDIFDAKQKVFEAQRNLNEAYAKAREEIEDLKFAAEDAALGEKKAALQLEKARETLLRVQDLPPNSRARREAELAFAQADLNYRKAIDTNKDLQKEQDRISREGVDGTKTVQDAKKRLNDATLDQTRTEAEAARDIARATSDLAKAKIEAENDVAQARAEAADARVRYDREEREANFERMDIMRRYNDEQRQQNEAVANANRNLRRAEDDLAEARKKGFAGASGGANAYQQALAKLSPEQRKFVEYMVNTFMPEIEKFQAAAAKKFFPQLIPALENLRTNLFPVLLPLLTETGNQLGNIAKNVSTALTSPQVVDNIKSVWDSVNTKILPSASTIISNAVTVASEVIAAAQPLVERFTSWIEGITTKWKNVLSTKEGQENLQTLLNKAGSIAGEIGGIIGNIFKGLGNIVKSQMEPDSGGYVMLRFFRDAAAAFKDFTSSPEGIARIEDFFKNTAANAKPILGFIGDLVKEFLKLGENPNIGAFFTTLRENNVAGIIGDIANTLVDAGPAIADFVTNFLGFVKATTDSGAITTFWDTLSTIFKILKDVFESPIMQQILPVIGGIAAAGVALRTAWGPAKMVFLAIADPLLKIGELLSKFNWVRFIDDVKGVIAIVGDGAGLFGKLKNLALLMGPQGILIGAIAGIVAIFVACWNESEKFRDAVKDLVEDVIQKAITIFENLKKKLDEALEPLGGMEGAVNMLKDAFEWLGDILAVTVVPFLEGTLLVALDLVNAAFGTIIDTVGNVIEGFQKIFEGFSEGDIGKVFEGIAQAIFAPFLALGDNLKQFFIDAWNSIVGVVKEVLGIASPSTVFTDIANAILDAIVNVLTFLPSKFIEFFTNAWTGVTNFITNTVQPFLTGLGTTIAGWISTMWDGITSVLSTAWTTVTTFFGPTGAPATFLTGLGETVTGWISKLWDGLLSLVKTAWTTVTTYLGPNGAPANFLRGLGKTVTGWLSGVWDGLKDILGDAWDSVLEFFGENSPVAKFIKGLKDKVAGWAGNIWGGLKSGLSAAVEGIKALLRPFRTVMNLFIKGANLVSGGNMAEIPPFAKGGIVYPKRGGVIAQVAEAGRPERIEPLDPDGLSKRDKAMIAYMGGGAGGATINVYATPGMDEIQLAKIVSREISFMMRKGSV